jgi:hypothetical protein
MNDGRNADLSQIEDLAASWLEAENDLTAGRTSSKGEAAARSLSERYAAAITGATQEELRLAWEAARRRQGDEVMGSLEWSEARRVSELLRTEYLARDGS